MQLFDTSTAANVEPPFGDKHGKSLARLERGAGAASRAEVLTNTGRCSCPFVASGVLARYARRIEFLLLATRFAGSRRRRVLGRLLLRVPSCPSQEPTAAALENGTRLSRMRGRGEVCAGAGNGG